MAWPRPYRQPAIRESPETFHNISSEENGAFVLLVQHAPLVEPLENPDVRRVKQGGVGVPEDGDEFVSIDLRFDRAERRVAAFVCERGAHWV